jgi:hypothetical protein
MFGPASVPRGDRSNGSAWLGMKLHEIPGYSVADWHQEREAESRGQHLACPNCGRAEWYHAVGVPPDTGAQRKYRACKVCGCWQEADGTPAYRCWMTVHTCLAHLAKGMHCPYCGIWGPRQWHAACWRILATDELGITRCAACDLVLTPQHVVPWPVQPE